jgi:hypothetical protein
MRGFARLLLSWLIAACSPASPAALPIPSGPGPVILAGTAEVLIVFPGDSLSDFPWPGRRLVDRFAGPFWSIVALGPGGTYVAAAARLRQTDSLDLPPFATLKDVLANAGLYDCSLDTHVIVCFESLEGALAVHEERLIVRITDARWVASLNRQRPDSSWLHVLRPNRQNHWYGKVAIQYLPGRGA